MERSNQEPSDSQETAERRIKEIASWKPAIKLETQFVIFYIVSMSLDPLLLYSLILNDDRKCIVVDTQLEKLAIVLRSLADLFYIRDFICEIADIAKETRKLIQGQGGRMSTFEIVKFLMKRIFWWQMVILAALPVPQIAILVFFPKLRASRALNKMRIMNSLILLQYVPRIYSISRYSKDLNKNKLDNDISDLERKRWVPGLLNFILYILASYVIGTFWYFFSIQRQIECWGHACQSGNGCQFRIFDCDNGPLKNVKLLNDLCPINPSDAKKFDFGIYLDALQSGMLGSTDFWQKFLYCFFWGIRNLSSFGSNLKTSMNAWENLFVVFISISGLLLFIYLLGHLQTFMQATNKEYWIRLKMWKINSDIKRMSDEYDLPNASGDIREIVKRQFRRDEDLAVENIFSILPLDVRKIIKRHLLLPKLKEVPTLQRIEEMMLDEIFLDHFEQVMYDGGNCIIRKGEPLDMMIFISRGRVLTYNDTTSTRHANTEGPWLTGGDIYGQELISWAATSTSFSNWPISEKTLKSHENVEVFAIRASALLRIVSEHERYFPQTQRDNNIIEINEHGRA